MLKTALIHPQILEALASAGHGSRVLISDGNFPHATTLGSNAAMVFANFAPGVIDAATMLKLLVEVLPIEAVAVMQPTRDGPHGMTSDPPIWADYRKVLDAGASLSGDFEKLDRFAFYEAAQDENVCLTIATGEQQTWANLLLTIGVVTSD